MGLTAASDRTSSSPAGPRACDVPLVAENGLPRKNEVQAQIHIATFGRCTMVAKPACPQHGRSIFDFSVLSCDRPEPSTANRQPRCVSPHQRSVLTLSHPDFTDLSVRHNGNEASAEHGVSLSRQALRRSLSSDAFASRRCGSHGSIRIVRRGMAHQRAGIGAVVVRDG